MEQGAHKLILILARVLLTACACLAEDAPGKIPAGAEAVVVSAEAAAKLGGEQVGSLTKGQIVTVVKTQAGWVGIKWNDAGGEERRGWVRARHLKIEAKEPRSEESVLTGRPDGRASARASPGFVINGAFGMTFGARFAPSGPSVSTYSMKAYTFKPTKPLKGFTNYFVSITPKTRRIHTIFTIADSNGGAERKLIFAAIRRKYGEPKDDLGDSRHYTEKGPGGIFYVIRSRDGMTIESRFICVSLNDQGCTLVSYMDMVLGKMAEEERLDDLDDSGL